MANVVLPSNHPASTKAVVLIYGWLGSQPKHLLKYANLYIELGCAVVYDIAPVMALMAKLDRPLDAIVLETVKKACEIIRDVEKQLDEEGYSSMKKKQDLKTQDGARGRILPLGQCKVPVIIHCFSNGGAFLSERLAFLVRTTKAKDSQKIATENGGNRSSLLVPSLSSKNEKKQKKPTYVDESAENDLVFLSDRFKTIGYEMYDSAPAYLSREASFTALETGVSNEAIKAIFKFLLVLFYNGYEMLNNCQIGDHEDVKFWKSMIENDLCSRQAFIYSAMDKITDPVKVDELIEERKRRGVQVVSLKFDDSDHVMHLRQHPDEYKMFINQIWQEVMISSQLHAG